MDRSELRYLTDRATGFRLAAVCEGFGREPLFGDHRDFARTEHPE